MAILDRLPESVRIVEVGPRDGLQNESRLVPTAAKVTLVEGLAAAGHRHIEVTSFVRPDRVPQLADADEVFSGVHKRTDVVYTVLVANERGLDRAIAAGARSIAVFTAASNTFSERNVGCDVRESLRRIEAVVKRARDLAMRLRAYISTAFVCPHEGVIAPPMVLDVLAALAAMGIENISLGDTIGAASPVHVDRLLDAAATHPTRVPLDRLALHMHDTHHRALANVLVGLQYGIREFDSSAGGLGGCPFAPGAPGNLDTRALVEMLEGMGISTGIDLALHNEAVKTLAEAIEKAIDS